MSPITLKFLVSFYGDTDCRMFIWEDCEFVLLGRFLWHLMIPDDLWATIFFLVSFKNNMSFVCWLLEIVALKLLCRYTLFPNLYLVEGPT